MHLTLHHTVPAAPAAGSPNTLAVAGLFGLGIDATQRVTIVPPTTLRLRPHQVVFITGPSGGGKSTLLRLIAAGAAQHTASVPIIGFTTPPPDARAALVDSLPGASLPDALRLLSLAGLGDAFVMLRKLSELSDGQRYRFQLAHAMARVEAQTHTPPPDAARPGSWPVVVADEFGTPLDRVTAKGIARSVRRWVDRLPVCFIAATTHDDLLEALSPDILIDKGLGDAIEVIERPCQNNMNRQDAEGAEEGLERGRGRE